jgi:hypothetical protein
MCPDLIYVYSFKTEFEPLRLFNSLALFLNTSAAALTLKNNMDNSIKESLWKQFGASIDMLENAMILCPPGHWDTDTKFWYNAYRCFKC